MGGAEDSEIRRANFQQWCGAPFSPSRIAKRLGFNTPAFWSDLYHGRKAFGEKLAREIERAANLARGSLDDADGAVEMPFSHDLLTALMKREPAERRQFESMLRAAVGLSPLKGASRAAVEGDAAAPTAAVVPLPPQRQRHLRQVSSPLSKLHVTAAKAKEKK